MVTLLLDAASRVVLATVLTSGEPAASDIARLVREGIGRLALGRLQVQLTLDRAWRGPSFRSELAALLPDVGIRYASPHLPNQRGAAERALRDLTPLEAQSTRADDPRGGAGTSPPAP